MPRLAPRAELRSNPIDLSTAQLRSSLPEFESKSVSLSALALFGFGASDLGWSIADYLRPSGEVQRTEIKVSPRNLRMELVRSMISYGSFLMKPQEPYHYTKLQALQSAVSAFPIAFPGIKFNRLTLPKKGGGQNQRFSFFRGQEPFSAFYDAARHRVVLKPVSESDGFGFGHFSFPLINDGTEPLFYEKDGVRHPIPLNYPAVARPDREGYFSTGRLVGQIRESLTTLWVSAQHPNSQVLPVDIILKEVAEHFPEHRPEDLERKRRPDYFGINRKSLAIHLLGESGTHEVKELIEKFVNAIIYFKQHQAIFPIDQRRFYLVVGSVKGEAGLKDAPEENLIWIEHARRIVRPIAKVMNAPGEIVIVYENQLQHKALYFHIEGGKVIKMVSRKMRGRSIEETSVEDLITSRARSELRSEKERLLSRTGDDILKGIEDAARRFNETEQISARRVSSSFNYRAPHHLSLSVPVFFPGDLDAKVGERKYKVERTFGSERKNYLEAWKVSIESELDQGDSDQNRESKPRPTLHYLFDGGKVKLYATGHDVDGKNVEEQMEDMFQFEDSFIDMVFDPKSGGTATPIRVIVRDGFREQFREFVNELQERHFLLPTDLFGFHQGLMEAGFMIEESEAIRMIREDRNRFPDLAIARDVWFQNQNGQFKVVIFGERHRRDILNTRDLTNLGRWFREDMASYWVNVFTVPSNRTLVVTGRDGVRREVNVDKSPRREIEEAIRLGLQPRVTEDQSEDAMGRSELRHRNSSKLVLAALFAFVMGGFSHSVQERHDIDFQQTELPVPSTQPRAIEPTKKIAPERASPIKKEEGPAERWEHKSPLEAKFVRFGMIPTVPTRVSVAKDAAAKTIAVAGLRSELRRAIYEALFPKEVITKESLNAAQALSQASDRATAFIVLPRDLEENHLISFAKGVIAALNQSSNRKIVVIIEGDLKETKTTFSKLLDSLVVQNRKSLDSRVRFVSQNSWRDELQTEKNVVFVAPSKFQISTEFGKKQALRLVTNQLWDGTALSHERELSSLGSFVIGAFLLFAPKDQEFFNLKDDRWYARSAGVLSALDGVIQSLANRFVVARFA
ncbi:MAG: hypothetical protein HY582_02170 [Candidatus Omnitrophica bacterium]|nr:hypothetical protein [Candidatus Omnitrophota bacterium]